MYTLSPLIKNVEIIKKILAVDIILFVRFSRIFKTDFELKYLKFQERFTLSFRFFFNYNCYGLFHSVAAPGLPIFVAAALAPALYVLLQI